MSQPADFQSWHRGFVFKSLGQNENATSRYRILILYVKLAKNISSLQSPVLLFNIAVHLHVLLAVKQPDHRCFCHFCQTKSIPMFEGGLKMFNAAFFANVFVSCFALSDVPPTRW